MGRTDPWELTKRRHIFLRKTGKPDYDYIGSCFDEGRVVDSADEWVKYTIE
jgi:hypothetical protein